MNALWLTDLHLDCYNEKQLEDYFSELKTKVKKNGVDFLLITGDISTGKPDKVTYRKYHFYTMLQQLQIAVDIPIYYVLGNHDFWYADGKISRVQANVNAIKGNWIFNPAGMCLHYVTRGKPHVLKKPDGSKIFITGGDGWADCRFKPSEDEKPLRLSNSHWNQVRMRDWFLIDDFDKCGPENPVYKMMEKIADKEARMVAKKLQSIKPSADDQVIILTHVPPFKENSLYQGKPSDLLPLYSSKVMGDTILEHCSYWGQVKNVKTFVLSGHTHSDSEFSPGVNIRSLTLAADYHIPQMGRILSF